LWYLFLKQAADRFGGEFSFLDSLAPSIPTFRFFRLTLVGLLVALQPHGDFKSGIESSWFTFADLERERLVSKSVEEGTYGNHFAQLGRTSGIRQRHQAAYITNESAKVFVVFLSASSELGLVERRLISASIA